MQFKIEKQFIIALTLIPKIKRTTVYRLLRNLNRDINSLADLIEYVAHDGDTQLMLLSVSDFDIAIKKAWKILDQSETNNIKMVSVLDTGYPPLLKSCNNPPIILNYLGDINLLRLKPTICIVGTSTPSSFGKRYSNYVASFFANKDFNIISGLTKGCDTAAHLGSINIGGTTSAVLTHGLDTINPKENVALVERIKESGVLVSEYFVGTSVLKKHFIERNRIQAALSLGVFIIECEAKSDIKYTADYAILYKKVLACMKPPMEAFNETKVSGNQALTRAGKAIGIYADNELKELAVLLKGLYHTLM